MIIESDFFCFRTLVSQLDVNYQDLCGGAVLCEMVSRLSEPNSKQVNKCLEGVVPSFFLGDSQICTVAESAGWLEERIPILPVIPNIENCAL